MSKHHSRDEKKQNRRVDEWACVTSPCQLFLGCTSENFEKSVAVNLLFNYFVQLVKCKMFKRSRERGGRFAVCSFSSHIRVREREWQGM